MRQRHTWRPRSRVVRQRHHSNSASLNAMWRFMSSFRRNGIGPASVEPLSLAKTFSTSSFSLSVEEDGGLCVKRSKRRWCRETSTETCPNVSQTCQRVFGFPGFPPFCRRKGHQKKAMSSELRFVGFVKGSHHLATSESYQNPS